MSIRNYIKKNRRKSSIAYSTICSGATSLNTPQLAAGSFINETELGKLYISYPMIESIKDVDIKTKDYKTLYISLDEISKYKQGFSHYSDYSNYRIIEERNWLIACDASRKRASLLVRFDSICTYDYFIHNLNQEKLYLYQKQNYIYNGHFLCILNSVSLFLLEYFQEDFWDRVTVI